MKDLVFRNYRPLAGHSAPVALVVDSDSLVGFTARQQLERLGVALRCIVLSNQNVSNFEICAALEAAGPRAIVLAVANPVLVAMIYARYSGQIINLGLYGPFPGALSLAYIAAMEWCGVRAVGLVESSCSSSLATLATLLPLQKYWVHLVASPDNHKNAKAGSVALYSSVAAVICSVHDLILGRDHQGLLAELAYHAKGAKRKPRLFLSNCEAAAGFDPALFDVVCVDPLPTVVRMLAPLVCF